MKQEPKDEKVIDVLRRLTKRIEEATVDINSIKYDIKAMKFDIMAVKSDTEITKVDVEKVKVDVEKVKVDVEKVKTDVENAREELGDKIVGAENRLNKRIEHVADLITIQLGGKLQKHEKRLQKLEQAQQIS